jgi:hypothetical protein
MAAGFLISHVAAGPALAARPATVSENEPVAYPAEVR